MANEIVKVLNMSTIECDLSAVTGKIVNVYDSFANAIAQTDTGLVTIYEVNGLTGVIGDAVTQHGKNADDDQAGLTVDINGNIMFGASAGKYWLGIYAGRSGDPVSVDLIAEDEESSSSPEESSSSPEESSSSPEESSSSPSSSSPSSSSPSSSSPSSSSPAV